MNKSKVNERGSYTDYLKISLICTLVFAIPSLGILLLGNLVEPAFALLLLVISLFINCPIVGVIAWLLRGADEVNGSMSLKIIGGMPGMFFGFLFGAFIAKGLSSQVAIIASTILFFCLGMFIGVIVGPKIGKRLLTKA
jgi:hypothetical protein